MLLKTGISRTCIYLSALSMALALALFLSSSSRLSATAYWAIYVTGGGHVWGSAFLFSSCLLIFPLLGDDLLKLKWALYFAAVPYFCLSVSFLIAAIRFSTANLTAPVVYGWVCLVHVVLSRDVQRKIDSDGPK